MNDEAAPRFLVTAGSTRERIDDVRTWGNVFTGGTGLAVARALTAIGRVELLTSSREHVAAIESANGGPDNGIHAISFTTHAELRDLLERRVPARRYDGVFMTAAVSDYRPTRVYAVTGRGAGKDGVEHWIVRDVQAAKVRSTHGQIAVLGEVTEKLVDLFRTRWQHAGLLVKFKLEVGLGPDELLAIARASRVASGADYLVANTLEMTTGPAAGAYLVGPDDGAEWISRAGLARRLATLAAMHTRALVPNRTRQRAKTVSHASAIPAVLSVTCPSAPASRG
jgi:phosphopantothenoylcysteine synthetase/decarboxylase